MHSISGWLMAKGEEVAEDTANQGEEGEQQLLRAGRVGNQAALERLLAPQERSLLRLCRGMLGHAEDAEDAVQETFLRALRSLDRFRGASSFRTWLFRIAINVCLDWKGRHRAADSEQIGSTAGVRADSPEETVQWRWQITTALATLPPQRRGLLILKEVEGWSVAEIAQALQCSEKRVHNELYQARRALATWRQREAQQEDRS